MAIGREQLDSKDEIQGEQPAHFCKTMARIAKPFEKLHAEYNIDLFSNLYELFTQQVFNLAGVAVDGCSAALILLGNAIDEDDSTLLIVLDPPADGNCKTKLPAALNAKHPEFNASVVTDQFKQAIWINNGVEQKAIDKAAQGLPPNIAKLQAAHIKDYINKLAVIRLNTDALQQHIIPQLEEHTSRYYSACAIQAMNIFNGLFPQVTYETVAIFEETFFTMLKDKLVGARFTHSIVMTSPNMCVDPIPLMNQFNNSLYCHPQIIADLHQPINFNNCNDDYFFNLEFSPNRSTETTDIAKDYFNALKPHSCDCKNSTLKISATALIDPRFIDDMKATLEHHPIILKKYQEICLLSPSIQRLEELNQQLDREFPHTLYQPKDEKNAHPVARVNSLSCAITHFCNHMRLNGLQNKDKANKLLSDIKAQQQIFDKKVSAKLSKFHFWKNQSNLENYVRLSRELTQLLDQSFSFAKKEHLALRKS